MAMQHKKAETVAGGVGSPGSHRGQIRYRQNLR